MERRRTSFRDRRPASAVEFDQPCIKPQLRNRGSQTRPRADVLPPRCRLRMSSDARTVPLRVEPAASRWLLHRPLSASAYPVIIKLVIIESSISFRIAFLRLYLVFITVVFDATADALRSSKGGFWPFHSYPAFERLGS
jgi:hypothetical protein